MDDFELLLLTLFISILRQKVQNPMTANENNVIHQDLYASQPSDLNGNIVMLFLCKVYEILRVFDLVCLSIQREDHTSSAA